MVLEKKILLSTAFASVITGSIGISYWNKLQNSDTSQNNLLPQEVLSAGIQQEDAMFNLSQAGADNYGLQQTHTSSSAVAFGRQTTSFSFGRRQESLSECQQELQEFTEVAKKLKESKTVTIDASKLDNAIMTKTPYAVDEEELKKIVSGLPNSSKNTHYWIDINKDNDKGSITISAYGRVACFDKSTQDTTTNTRLIASTKISGLQKISKNQIVTERVVKIYTHTNDWGKDGRARTFDNYKDGIQKDWGKVNFSKEGTGFVLDKEEGKPIYYIATNKHVIDGAAERNKKLHHNLDKIGVSSPDNVSVYATQIDSAMCESRQYENNECKDKKSVNELPNLKGLITFGQDRPGYWLDTTGSLEDIFEFRDESRDSIKSIQMIADFSRPHYEFQSSTAYEGYKMTFNQNYSELPDVVVGKDSATNKDIKDKITLDLVILKVEFADDSSDPFKSWWSERPTKARLMKEEDLFTDFKEIKQIKNTNTHRNNRRQRTQYTTSYERHSTNSNNTYVNLEKGDGLYNNFITGGFPAFNTYTDQFYWINQNRGIKITEAPAFSSPHWFQQGDGAQHGMNSYAGRLTHKNIHGQQLAGASGSPIFDKNLNVVGILWGGTAPTRGWESSYDSGNNFVNWFQWFGQSFDSQKFSDTKDVPTEYSDVQRTNIPQYDVINGASGFSLKTQRDKAIS